MNFVFFEFTHDEFVFAKILGSQVLDIFADVRPQNFDIETKIFFEIRLHLPKPSLLGI